MKPQSTLASILPLAALSCAALLGGAAAAQAQGRILVTEMHIESCEEMGNCELRLTCQSGGEPKPVEMIPSVTSTNPHTIPINKNLNPPSFPTKVTCTLYEDDGWFGVSWGEAATGSLDLEGGGDYQLKLSNPDEATVIIPLLVDSLQVAPPPAPPAAAPGAKPAKAPAPAAATQFLGIFRREAEPSGHAVVLGLEEPSFLAEAKKLADRGVHPTDVETWSDGGRRLWGGIFRSGPDTSLILTGLDGDAFLKRWTQLDNKEEMRLIDLEVYTEKGKLMFAGVFRNGTEPSSLWVGQDRDAFKVKWQQLINQGVRLVDLEVYKGIGGRNIYAGVFLDAPGSYGMWNAVTWDKFLERWKASGSNGLADIESYMENGKRLYDGVVLGGSGSEEIAGPLTEQALAAKWKEMSAKGFRLVGMEAIQ